MEEIKKKIEAVLFATGRAMSIADLSKLCNVESETLIKDALEEMRKDFEERKSSLQIFGENDLWKLILKKEYHSLASNLLHKTELDKTLIETLGVIAWKQPILQSDVVKVRGTLTYEHIKLLKELDFVETEKFGRTRKLKLTGKFYDYFDISRDQLKEKFKGIKDKDLDKQEIKEDPQAVFIPDKPLI